MHSPIWTGLKGQRHRIGYFSERGSGGIDSRLTVPQDREILVEM